MADAAHGMCMRVQMPAGSVQVSNMVQCSGRVYACPDVQTSKQRMMMVTCSLRALCNSEGLNFAAAGLQKP